LLSLMVWKLRGPQIWSCLRLRFLWGNTYPYHKAAQIIKCLIAFYEESTRILFWLILNWSEVWCWIDNLSLYISLPLQCKFFLYRSPLNARPSFSRLPFSWLLPKFYDKLRKFLQVWIRKSCRLF
jgi:hypothetical protein